MRELGGFPIETVHAVRVPGLPGDGGLVTLGAERSGQELPTFLTAEVAKVFFAKGPRWLRRQFALGPNPQPGDRFYFPHESDDGGDEWKRWTLGDVERMTCWFHEHAIINYRKYIIARQTVAWIARGHGVYDG